MNSRRKVAVLVVSGVLFLLFSAQARAAAGRPPGVPDLTDPAVRDHFAPVSLSRLGGDPDFPALLLANLGEGVPQYVLLIFDARNGKETWSPDQDAVVFYLLLADPTTIQQVFLDEGFAARGRASGKFIGAGPEKTDEILARLREGYLRCRGLARLGTVI